MKRYEHAFPLIGVAIIALLILFAFNSDIFGGVIGYQTEGTAAVQTVEGTVVSYWAKADQPNPTVMPVDGRFDSVTACLIITASGTIACRSSIYRRYGTSTPTWAFNSVFVDSSRNDTNITFSAADTHWVSMPMIGNTTGLKDSVYSGCVWCSSSAGYALSIPYDGVVGDTGLRLTSAYTNGWASDIGWTRTASRVYSIYITYTPLTRRKRLVPIKDIGCTWLWKEARRTFAGGRDDEIEL